MSAPTVQRVLRNAFTRYADSICVTWEGACATYAATEARVLGIAAELQRRTAQGAHVGVLLPNGREFVETILACAAGARVRVSLNDREQAGAIAAKLHKADCSLLVTTPDLYETLASEGEMPDAIMVGGDGPGSFEAHANRGASWSELEVAKPGDLFRLGFTGGTTGTPKAVAQTHRQELALVRNLLLEVYRPAQDRVFVAATPMAHASGSLVLPTVVGGGRVSWTERFDPDRIADTCWLEDRPQAQTFVVPTALADLTSAIGRSGQGVDTVIYGGAPCPADVLARAVETIGPRLVQIYGQVEVPMTVCILGREDHANPSELAGCVGHPFLHVDVALHRDGKPVEEPGGSGEVVVYADHVMEGYWKDEAATAERFTPDGGLRTQDVARRDAHGRLWLVGRTREMLISGGYNIFPGEVEQRLGAVAGVDELAAFAVPHDRWGEALAIAVVPRDGIGVEDARSSVAAAARERLATYEQPKLVVVVESLPKTAVGKVSRADLATAYTGSER